MAYYKLEKDISTSRGGWFLEVNYWGKKKDMHFATLYQAITFIKQKEAMFGETNTI